MSAVEDLIDQAGLTPLHPLTPERTDTGWERVDLFGWLSGERPDDSPKLGFRSDGIPLLYPGRVHAFNGEPESGKSWIAQFVCAQELAAGHKVLILDFEDGPGALVDRMVAMGVQKRHLIRSLHYHQIAQPWSGEAAEVFDRMARDAEFTLVVVDGVTEAMSACGLSPSDNGEVARWWSMIPRRLSRTGAAVVIIDHVTKDREARGRWALGAQHKMAALDGGAFTIEAKVPFGRGKRGVATMLIKKDRPGWLRQSALGDRLAEFTLISAHKAVTATLSPCLPAYHNIMLDISRILSGGGSYASSQLHEALPRWKATDVDRARSKLVELGHVHERMQGRQVYYTLIRPYT
jgi:AAA domain